MHASNVAVAAVLSASIAECHQHMKPEIGTQQKLLKQNVLDGRVVSLLDCWSGA